MSDLDDTLKIAGIGAGLLDALLRAAIGYAEWQAKAAAAKAEGRDDFTQEELDEIHAKMQATTDRFLSRDFTEGGQPDPT